MFLLVKCEIKKENISTITPNVSDNRSFPKRSERKFGKMPSRGIFRLSLVRREFISATLLFYQIMAEMKAQRPLEFSFKKLFLRY